MVVGVVANVVVLVVVVVEEWERLAGNRQSEES